MPSWHYGMGKCVRGLQGYDLSLYKEHGEMLWPDHQSGLSCYGQKTSTLSAYLDKHFLFSFFFLEFS